MFLPWQILKSDDRLHTILPKLCPASTLGCWKPYFGRFCTWITKSGRAKMQTNKNIRFLRAILEGMSLLLELGSPSQRPWKYSISEKYTFIPTVNFFSLVIKYLLVSRSRIRICNTETAVSDWMPNKEAKKYDPFMIISLFSCVSKKIRPLLMITHWY